jgi:UDP-N-acetylmuramoyl-L-alanyl-D-glutamate--2,6-diaminopimelate ligase
VNIVRNILNGLGEEAVSIGTLGVVGLNEKPIDFGMTTPDSLTLVKYLNLIANNKIDNVALEASSHGLYLNRLDNIEIKAAAFTNFTQDHLDFHKTFDAYFDAKMLLFTKVMQKGVVVVNQDINEFSILSSHLLINDPEGCR